MAAVEVVSTEVAEAFTEEAGALMAAEDSAAVAAWEEAAIEEVPADRAEDTEGRVVGTVDREADITADRVGLDEVTAVGAVLAGRMVAEPSVALPTEAASMVAAVDLTVAPTEELSVRGRDTRTAVRA